MEDAVVLAAIRERIADPACPPEERRILEEGLAEVDRRIAEDPLQGFWPHPEREGQRPQMVFMDAKTPVQAAFAGNQFGKTTSLTVKSLIQCVPSEELPKRLRRFKLVDAPALGRIVGPSFTQLEGVLLPAFRQWTPARVLRGGSFDKAFSKEFRTLHFACGSQIQFMTYEMTLDKFGGSTLHFIGYDEPPPKQIRGECLMRLVRHGGFEMFACTPLKANTGWMRREIWRKREAPDVTVVRASMHDNPLLGDKEKERTLSQYPEWERRAREFGDFMDFGGLIYPDFERCVVPKPSPEHVQSLDIVVGIDPGIRNAGIAFNGFDRDNAMLQFDELLLQDKTPKDYAVAIRRVLARWGLSVEKVGFVIDPSARSRGLTNAETVMTLLNQEGIYPNLGQNDHEAGFSQMRTRMAHKRFLVSEECRITRDQADDYAAKEPDEGQDDSHLVPVRGNEHILDADRYCSLERPWDPVMEQTAPDRQLGYVPDQAPAAKYLNPAPQSAPMGAMS